jgi:uncharacterized protein
VIKLDIGSLPDGFSHTDLSVEASELDVALEGGHLESPVEIGLDVTRTGRDIIVRGKASVTAVLECARCLEEYTYVLESPLELLCLTAEEGGGPDFDDDREHVIEMPVGAKYVDLADHVRSELLVLVPLKPLCTESCKGLCPRCGANLNDTQCSCSSESSDDRWDALRNMK